METTSDPYSSHLFFRPAELFCMGFSFSAFFFFVLITRTAHLDYNSGFFFHASPPSSCPAHSLVDVSPSPPLTVNLAVSSVIGVLGGVTLVTSWWRFGSVMACVVVVGLVLGFMVASTVLFTPLGGWVGKKTLWSRPLNAFTWQRLCVLWWSGLRWPQRAQAIGPALLGDFLLHHGHGPAFLLAMA